MKKIIVVIISIISFNTYSQIDANSVLGLPEATNAEMLGITGMQLGSTLYNTTDLSVYVFNGTAWVKTTDGINAGDVNLITAVDVDGDGATETTVEEIVEDITDITSTAARIFYPPSIAIDASSTGVKPPLDLHQEYIDQFSAVPVTSRSTGAPAAIPTYAETDLYYYVTDFDPAVFNITGIDANGMMSYEVLSVPSNLNSIINVVFVVR